METTRRATCIGPRTMVKMTFARFVPVAMIVLTTLPACTAFAPPPRPGPQEMVVRVVGDPGEPLEAVEIRASEGTVARTNAAGVARLAFTAGDGTKIDLAVGCPAGYAANRSATVVVKRTDRTPEYEVTCRRLLRNVVVALRASGAGGLPVLHMNREVAKLDDAGYALFALRARAGDTLSLTLDTSDLRFKHLRPQSPELAFSIPDGDDVFVAEPAFTEERPKVVHAPPPKPIIPIRIE